MKRLLSAKGVKSDTPTEVEEDEEKLSEEYSFFQIIKLNKPEFCFIISKLNSNHFW